ncbi:hypothetical protein [Absidia glauca]|uniref:Integrase catalytic domain-containing protein n=1 Tax=Absidia glauca TaxID=4829 RepID=A0A163JUP8_ABSGL|nr:hypothetical protein [Absidia glauca]
MSSINEHAAFWTQDGNPHRELEQEIVGGMITHLEAQVALYFGYGTPGFEFNEGYEEELKRLVKELVPPYGMRRMVLTRVLATNPWLVAEGPALPDVGDVAVAAPLAENEALSLANSDLFSSLLGLESLFDCQHSVFRHLVFNLFFVGFEHQNFCGQSSTFSNVNGEKKVQVLYKGLDWRIATELLHPVPVGSRPFEQWAFDVKHVPTYKTGARYIIAGIEYLTKWVEARAVRYQTSAEIASFIYEEIITRYGCPHIIITDNGKPFISDLIKKSVHTLRYSS